MTDDIRKLIEAAVSAEEEALEEMLARQCAQRDNGAPPVWKRDPGENGCTIRGSDGMIIYDEGGHDALDAAHIARHDPARLRHEIALARLILGQHRRTPAIPGAPFCQHCGMPEPCTWILALWEAWRVREDPGSQEPAPAAAFSPPQLIPYFVLEDGTEQRGVIVPTGQAIQGGSAKITVKPEYFTEETRYLRVTGVIFRTEDGEMVFSGEVRDQVLLPGEVLEVTVSLV